jgi:type IV secretion system protein TrbI
MNLFSRRDNKPTVSTEPQEPVRSFWERYRKTIILFAACFALLAVGRACSSKQEVAKRATKAAHIQSESAREQADKDGQIELLRSQLLEEQKRSSAERAASDAADPIPQNPLTPAQRRQIAARESSTQNDSGPMQYGSGVRQQRPSSADNLIDSAGNNKPVSLVISYRQAADSESKATTAAAPAKSTPEAAAAGNEQPKTEQEPDLDASTGRKYRIRQGTWLPCTEQLRINGAFAGNINCLVSIPIYSTSGSHLLMPQGTIALGRVVSVHGQGQQRLYVSFDSFIMPDGFTVTIKDAAGLDQIGQTGLRDKVNHHYGQMFGVSIALAAVSSLAQIGNYGNASITPASQYRAGMTQGMSESAMRILDRFTNILPTFVIREGARNNIHLPMSLYLPDYSNHALQGDL